MNGNEEGHQENAPPVESERQNLERRIAELEKISQVSLIFIKYIANLYTVSGCYYMLGITVGGNNYNQAI